MPDKNFEFIFQPQPAVISSICAVQKLHLNIETSKRKL